MKLNYVEIEFCDFYLTLIVSIPNLSPSQIWLSDAVWGKEVQFLKNLKLYFHILLFAFFFLIYTHLLVETLKLLMIASIKKEKY